MDAYSYPLHISRAAQAAQSACAQPGGACHDAVLRLADALTYYLGAVAVAQYSQALYTEQIEPDPTLNRSLRSLRRLLPGQWLTWVARGLEATPHGPVRDLHDWYLLPGDDGVAVAYETLRRLMVERLSYAGDYGPQEQVAPRLLLELVDQYRIRRSKTSDISPELDSQVGQTLLPGLTTALGAATFLAEYPLYAPQQRRLLMGLNPTTPMPPMSAPADASATLLLYPPGEPPDYTKRPNLQAERLPLFPLDPLLIYIHCEQCDTYRIAALQAVVNDRPTYLGLDPDCGHTITLGNT